MSAAAQRAPGDGGEDILTLDICVLSAEEAGRLENFGIWPICKSGEHRHISRKKLAPLLSSGAVRWVGGEGTCVETPVSMVTLVKVKMWQPVPSRAENGATLLGLRTWGLVRS